MAKVVDITEKLSFDENPRLRIRDREIEVNTDAATVLKLMGLFKDKSELEAVSGAFDLLLDGEGKETVGELGLSFKDLQTVIATAMDLAMGEGETGGEQ